MTNRFASNREVAEILERVSDLLEVQGADLHRIRAYRRAASEIENLPEQVSDIVNDAERKLEDLPGIGKSIAGAIREFVHTGRLRMLERLEGEVSPEDLFCTIPGIGEELAERIHSELHVETLEELEAAAHDGRLASIKGMGDRRVRGIRAALEAALSQSTRRRSRQRGFQFDLRDHEEPSVATIIEVDKDYRLRARSGRLRKIAPRRFNPKGEVWLPIWHVERDGWSFTALFSNTARAHELGKTGDWVVLFFEQDGHEKQRTVVTETQGQLKGLRVIRGREPECLEHYKAKTDS